MRVIWKRELLSFFHTPIGFVVIGVFQGLAGVIFYLNNLRPLSGELLRFFSSLTLLTMLLSPMLTMRLLCEERQRHTDQLLMTSPVSLARIVAGKFLSAAAVLLMAIVSTNVYTVIIGLYGTVYPGEWFVGYLGFTLQSLSFLALDMLVSCPARNQVSAAVFAFAANFVMWILDVIVRLMPLGLLGEVFEFVSLYNRYEPFVLGQLSFANVLFYVLFIAVCVTATVRVLDGRRFSRGGAA